jgi:hypothetical protein
MNYIKNKFFNNSLYNFNLKQTYKHILFIPVISYSLFTFYNYIKKHNFFINNFQNYKENYSVKKLDEPDELDKYENKYIDLFEEQNKSLKEIYLTEDEKNNMKNNILMEITPKGQVIMFYNYCITKKEDTSSFNYYSDDKNISFNYLNTIARKYVVTYKCCEFYIDSLNKNSKQNITKDKNTDIKEKTIDIKEENIDIKGENIDITNDKTNVNKDIFATFKKYKKTNITPLQKNNNIEKNRFTRLGTIEDYNNLIIQKNKPLPLNKNMSFLEYKNNFMSDNK